MLDLKRNKAWPCLIAMSLSLAPAAQAELEEIVVVAQKRSENLQDVPIAITALSAETIEKADIRDLGSMATRVPGLSFSPFSPGQNIVSLRGASSNDDGAGTDNSVAVFVDDVYLGRVSNINPEMFDLERIEVLRGPQGTLYGKNTIGGAINIVSTRPNSETTTGRVKVGLGNYDRREIAGLISGPLSANWSGKISATHRQRDGWVDNVVLNKKQKDDNSTAVRAQLLFESDTMEALLSADYNRLDVEDMARIPVETGNPDDPSLFTLPLPGSYAELCPERGSRCSAGPVDGFAKRDAYGVSAKLSWFTDIGDWVSITAWRESEADWNMDSTGTPAPIGRLNDDIFDATTQFSQELRFVGDGNDQYNYVLGLWYLQEDTDRTECFDVDLDDSDCTPDADNGRTDWYRQVNETTSVAAFGQLNWYPSDRWKVALGGRFSYEKKRISNEAVAGNFVVINQSFAADLEESWNAFTPKLTVDYQLAQGGTAYASIARGFKSGGFAAAPQGIEFTAPLDQEEATNYEVGLKTDIGNNLRVNSALFYTDYKYLQIQTFGPLRPASSFGTFQTFNSGDARVQGVELEAIWQVSDRLSLSGFYNLQDSEFQDTIIPGTAFPNQTGQELLHTPRTKYNLNLDYLHPLASGASVDLSVSYQFTDDERGELEPWAVQPAYDILDARLSWLSADEQVEISLWGKNLADEEYISHLYTVASSVVAVFGEPRMYGASVSYRF